MTHMIPSLRVSHGQTPFWQGGEWTTGDRTEHRGIDDVTRDDEEDWAYIKLVLVGERAGAHCNDHTPNVFV